MVQVCCFQCDPRLATYIIAIISTLHFTVEVILLANLDTEHRLVAEDDGIKFYTVFSTHIFLLIASILLFLSAYFLNRLLCIPWILGCIFNLIIYSALLILIIYRLFEDWNIVELEKGLFISLTIATLVYCMWIVAIFFLELGNESNTSTENGERTRGKKSIFTLYDTEEETDMEDEENQKFLGSNKRSNNGRISRTKITGTKDDTLPLLNNDRR